jgi:hypothetical protein
MLRITKAQLEYFSGNLEKYFVDRIIPHLQEHFSEALKHHGLQEQARLEALVRRGIDEAESFGVVCEQDVRLYLECLLIFHPLFAHDPSLPWVAGILRQVNLSGTEKMNQLHDRVVFGTFEGGQ